MSPVLRRIPVAAVAAVMLAPARGVGAAAHPRSPRDSHRPAPAQRQRDAGHPAGHEGPASRVVRGDAGRLKAMTPEERQQLAQQGLAEQLAVIEASDFGDGVIEAEIAGAPRADAGEGARGFVGIAFRVQRDLKTYDAFYLRPTNGRADDQVRRNHSAQYISHPDWPWFRLRKESPREIRVLRRPRARANGRRFGSKSAARGQAVRARPGAADAYRERREERRQRPRGDRTVDRQRHRRALPQPDRDARAATLDRQLPTSNTQLPSTILGVGNW